LILLKVSGVNQLVDKGHKGVLGVKRSSSEMMERRDGVQEPCIWSSPEGGKGEVEPGKRIFCNRVLNMRSVKAVGLHMDYTLAQYKPETFEKLVV
jgi:hypothetical protein